MAFFPAQFAPCPFFLAYTHQGSANSRAFYAKARGNLRLQATTLCGVAFLGVAITAFKQLTVAGRSTPIIAWTAQVHNLNAIASSSVPRAHAGGARVLLDSGGESVSFSVGRSFLEHILSRTGRTT